MSQRWQAAWAPYKSLPSATLTPAPTMAVTEWYRMSALRCRSKEGVRKEQREGVATDQVSHRLLLRTEGPGPVAAKRE